MQGRISDKPVSSLLRGLAQKNASGLLRFSRGKTIKAIFFEAGAPTFAISNVTQEQLEYRLVHGGLVTQAQIEQAKQRAEKANKLGSMLVEMGMLSLEAWQKAVEDQVREIILSLFAWEQGDYVFDEKMRAVHDVTLSIRTTDLLLEGARQVADNQQFARLIAPLDGVLIRASLNQDLLDSGKLLPMESYILSRIEAPTVVSEVGALSGIPEEEALKAVCALLAGGFLKLIGDDREEESFDPLTSDSTEKLREDIARRIGFYSQADLYEILEIGRQVSMGEVKAAYYHLAKKYHPDRYRQPELVELRGQLESLFAKISQAYETLSEPASRAAYDLKLKKENTAAPRAKASEATSITSPLPASVVAAKPLTGELNASKLSQGQPVPVGPAARAPTVVVSEPQIIQGAAPSRNPDFYYQQGRARLERKDYHSAVHMLREAVKLDSSKAIYHFHLGVALMRNPRTRREAEEHLSQAADIDKYNPQLRVKLGLLFKEIGLKRRAEHYFNDALSLDPDNRIAIKELSESKDAKKENLPSIWKADVGTIAKRLFKK